MTTTSYRPLYLAIDQGGHASRALVFDALGQVVTQAHASVATQTPQTNWVEHDPEVMLASVQQVIHKAIEPLDARRGDIVAAGLATQRASLCCWDKFTGMALSPIISWQDRRNHRCLSRIQSEEKSIHQRTGLMLSPHYGANKIRWCLDHLPEVKQAQRKNQLVIGPLASFLVYHLLKQRPLVADPANASRTLLWNLASAQWDDALLKLFDIPRAVLPDGCQTRHTFGDLVIADLNIPLTILTGDQSAALFAWGKARPDTSYINMGTGAFVQRPLSTPCVTERLLTSVVYVDEKNRDYALEGTVNGAARALQWLNIDRLEKQLSQWLTGIKQPPLFLNSVAGIGSPYWAGHFEPCFIGEGSIAAKAVAIVESIVFLLQANLDEMARHLPLSRQIVVSGGLAQIAPLCQKLADLSDLVVKRPDTAEASARGLAFLLANRPDNWSMVNERCFFPQANPGLKQRYLAWQIKLEQKLSETPGEEITNG